MTGRTHHSATQSLWRPGYQFTFPRFPGDRPARQAGGGARRLFRFSWGISSLRIAWNKSWLLSLHVKKYNIYITISISKIYYLLVSPFSSWQNRAHFSHCRVLCWTWRDQHPDDRSGPRGNKWARRRVPMNVPTTPGTTKSPVEEHRGRVLGLHRAETKNMCVFMKARPHNKTTLCWKSY